MADAETYNELDPNNMMFKVSTSDNIRNFNNGIQVQKYHYSFEQLLLTSGTARYKVQHQITTNSANGVTGYANTYGSIVMPTITTAATGTLSGYQNTYRSPNSGSANIDMDSSTNTLLNVIYPTAGGTIGNAGGLYWNGAVGEPNRDIDITLSQGTYTVSLGDRITPSIMSSILLNATGTDTETHNDIGTLSYEAFTDNIYYALRYDWDANTTYYIYMYYDGLPMKGNLQLSYTPSFRTVYEDAPDGAHGSRGFINVFSSGVTDSFNVIANASNASDLAQNINLPSANRYVLGQTITYKPTTDCELLLVSIPKFALVKNSVENSIQTQTNTMMDTTGSDGVLGTATGVSNTIQNKLGFVTQTANTVTNVYDSVMNAEPNGTVTFPGLAWNGQTIIAAQQVPLLGWLTPIEEQVKLAITAMLVLAWLHGVRLIYGRIFLGETDVVTDGEE